MPRILCLGTATHLCSVAVWGNGRVLAFRDEEERTRYTHAERLHVLVEEVMKEAGMSMRELDAVAVDIGPGSYTGLRIGLSAAKGYCYALGVPIIGIGTLDVLVAALGSSPGAPELADGDVLHPMIDARRMEVYTGPPAVSAILSEHWVAALDPARRHVVLGDGADKAAELWRSQAHVLHVPGVRPRAADMASLAEQRHDRQEFDDLAYLVPVYGKEPNVTLPKP